MYLYSGIYLNIISDWGDYVLHFVSRCTLCLDAHVGLHSELSTDVAVHPGRVEGYEATTDDNMKPEVSA